MYNNDFTLRSYKKQHGGVYTGCRQLIRKQISIVCEIWQYKIIYERDNEITDEVEKINDTMIFSWSIYTYCINTSGTCWSASGGDM